MRTFISTIITAVFIGLAFASSDTDSTSLKANEAKCDKCGKVYEKSSGWTYNTSLLCVTYQASSSGIFCSRWCAQGRAMSNGALDGRSECN